MKKEIVGKVLNRAKDIQKKFQNIVHDKAWVEEARLFADQRSGELKKILASDVEKIKKFLETEKKGLEDLQSELSGEVKRLKGFISQQKKDLKGLLKKVGQTQKRTTAPKRKTKKTTKSKKETHAQA